MTSPSSFLSTPSGVTGKNPAAALAAEGNNIGLGKYRILRLLEQGGLSIIYLAQDKETGEKVVIKKDCPPDYSYLAPLNLQVDPLNEKTQSYGSQEKRKGQQETLILLQLDHPNIVKVTDTFTDHGTACYVMPWISGGELGQVAPAPDTITEEWLAPILRQLLEALQYLHGKNILHRDIKPSNILMSEGSEPVLIDFGAACAIIGEKAPAKIGTPGYTPIEQVTNDGPIGPWTDLYALGATCYRLITGHRPPSCECRMEEYRQYLPLASRTELYSRFSRDFLAAVDKALALRYEERLHSAEEWLAALPAPVTSHSRAGMPLYVWLIIALLLLIILCGGCYACHTISILQAQVEARPLADTPLPPAEGFPLYAKLVIACVPLILLCGSWLAYHVITTRRASMAARASAFSPDAPTVPAEQNPERTFNVTEYLQLQAIRALSSRGIYTGSYEYILHEAAEQGDTELLYLLLTAGVDVNLGGSEGFTALMSAVRSGKTEAARLLLDAGANVNALFGIQFSTPLDFNITHNDEIERMLRAAGGKTGAEIRRMMNVAEEE